MHLDQITKILKINHKRSKPGIRDSRVDYQSDVANTQRKGGVYLLLCLKSVILKVFYRIFIFQINNDCFILIDNYVYM